MLTKLLVMLICILAAPVLIMSSCKKDAATVLKADAIILAAGDPAADGCGWLITITGTDSTYSPSNLPDSYKKDSLKVRITYRKLATKFQCGLLPGHGFRQIQLDAIKK